MVKKAKNREVKERKRGYTSGILFFSFVLLIGLLIALVALLPQFSIQEVRIEGNKKVSDEKILEQMDIALDEHLFFYLSGNVWDFLQLRYGEKEDLLLSQFPYIEDAKIQAKFPYAVEVNISERVEIANIDMVDQFAVMDKDGRVLDVVKKNDTPNVPVIRGLAYSSLQPGDLLDEEQKRALERSIKFIESVLRTDRDAADDFHMLGRIEYIFPYSANTLYAQIKVNEKQSIPVRLNPQEAIGEKVAWLRNAIKQEVFLELSKGVLDLSGKKNIFSPSQTVPATPTPSPTTAESTKTGLETNPLDVTEMKRTTNDPTTVADTFVEDNSRETTTVAETTVTDTEGGAGE